MRRHHRIILAILTLAFASACNLLGQRTVFPAPDTPTPGPSPTVADTPEPTATTIDDTPTVEPTATEELPVFQTDVAVIYHNGDIITMDDEQPTAQAIAISDGKFGIWQWAAMTIFWHCKRILRR